MIYASSAIHKLADFSNTKLVAVSSLNDGFFIDFTFRDFFPANYETDLFIKNINLQKDMHSCSVQVGLGNGDSKKSLTRCKILKCSFDFLHFLASSFVESKLDKNIVNVPEDKQKDMFVAFSKAFSYEHNFNKMWALNNEQALCCFSFAMQILSVFCPNSPIKNELILKSFSGNES